MLEINSEWYGKFQFTPLREGRQQLCTTFAEPKPVICCNRIVFQANLQDTDCTVERLDGKPSRFLRERMGNRRLAEVRATHEEMFFKSICYNFTATSSGTNRVVPRSSSTTVRHISCHLRSTKHIFRAGTSSTAYPHRMVFIFVAFIEIAPCLGNFKEVVKERYPFQLPVHFPALFRVLGGLFHLPV